MRGVSMNLPSTLANFLQRNHQRRTIRTLEDRLHLQHRQIRLLTSAVQGSTDVTTNTDSTSSLHYIGTPSRYNTYRKQVLQLGYLYDNTANWGCMITKNIIDVRTAFSVGDGVRPIKRSTFKGSAERELSWVKEFMRVNNLDEEMPQEYAKEAEIEGKVLLRFLVDMKLKQIRVIHVPWRQYEYEITTPDYDYFDYTQAEYIGSTDKNVSFNLTSPFFVYKRFGGSASKVNDTPPKTAFVLREIEDLDKAIWDWRKINRLFSAPTPFIKCSDAQTAKQIQEWLEGSNWRIGKSLILGGLDVDFKLVGWDGEGYTTLKEETQALVKTISGTTGIPVHFFGYPELLSNRDTAENLSQLIGLSTSKERRTWIGTYEELFQKAMIIYNTAFGTALNPQAIDVTIDDLPDQEQVNEAVSNSQNTGAEQGRDRSDN